MTIAFGLLASVFFGLSDFLGGTLSRSVSAFRVLVVAQIVATTAMLPALVSSAPALASDALIWGAVAGCANAVALACLYTALARGTMGVVAPISAAGVVVPVIAGVLAGEPISFLSGTGILLLVVGTVFAAGPESSKKSSARAGGQSIVLAITAAATFGIAVLALGRGSISSVPVTLFTSNALSALLFMAVALILRNRLRLTGKALIGASLVGLFSLAANWLFATAASQGFIVIVAVLAALYPVVTALLARHIHAERLRPVQLAGVCSVLAGIAAMVAA